MNYPMIRKLVGKDWYFHRWTIATYLLIGGLAIGLIAMDGKASFYVGAVLFVSVLIGLGIHLTMATVVVERDEHTLPFIMSLPISAGDYTLAKVLANLAIFLLPWLVLLLGAVSIIYTRAGLPNGLIPYAILSATVIFALYCMILGVALVSESQTWTIVAVVVGNLGFNFFLFFVGQLPAIEQHIEGPVAVFNCAFYGLLLAQLGFALAAIALTFYLQSKKTDFL